jgi:hypothetical protein
MRSRSSIRIHGVCLVHALTSYELTARRSIQVGTTEQPFSQVPLEPPFTALKMPKLLFCLADALERKALVRIWCINHRSSRLMLPSHFPKPGLTALKSYLTCEILQKCMERDQITALLPSLHIYDS